ncbi:hypothetical protein P7K49_000526 [Saguinus oedipus]|uniref:Uncharacterized protein n=1 Tax=Saguinus oedipus TaxID=9490 RepID=A0ABQ9WCE6_SAGOE|nr:hypothetical protein P7K49_000526 [Saguinus oedipus]
MDSGTDEYELNGVLPPGTPGSPDTSSSRAPRLPGRLWAPGRVRTVSALQSQVRPAPSGSERCPRELQPPRQGGLASPAPLSSALAWLRGGGLGAAPPAKDCWRPAFLASPRSRAALSNFSLAMPAPPPTLPGDGQKGQRADSYVTTR